MNRMLSSHTFFAITKASSHTVQSVSCCEALFLAEAGDLRQFRRQRKNWPPIHCLNGQANRLGSMRANTAQCGATCGAASARWDRTGQHAAKLRPDLQRSGHITNQSVFLLAGAS
jgi:hypothetical protein